MGTPEFAAVILRKILSQPDFEVVAVFAQPDKRAGRGLKTILPGAVARVAATDSIPLYQPTTLKDGAALETIKAARPDFLVVAAYGKIIPDAILETPKYDCLNVHGSLLPAYRGAAPAQRAVMDSWRGDDETGVCVMRVVPELDAGPVYAARKIVIGTHTSASLLAEMAREGADLLIATMRAIAEENIRPAEQDASKATFAPKLTKEDGLIHWTDPLKKIDAQIRAVYPWPGATARVRLAGQEIDRIIKIENARAEERPERDREPGTIVREGAEIRIYCADGYFVIDQVKPEGKAAMKASDYLNGQVPGKLKICGRCE